MPCAALLAEFRKAADPARAADLARYFKTGKGQYAEGDRFLGLTVPAVRRLALRHRDLPLPDITRLLASPWHEHRLCALLLMKARFLSSPQQRRGLYRLYLSSTARINNWDLVDLSAPAIVGGWLRDRSRRPLYRLAASRLVWERRIALLACFDFLRRGETDDALALTRLLLDDEHDLIHKAAGWLLREAGKCSERTLLDFLEKNYARLPRTTLRYAIERFPQKKRKALLAGNFGPL